MKKWERGESWTSPPQIGMSPPRSPSQLMQGLNAFLPVSHWRSPWGSSLGWYLQPNWSYSWGKMMENLQEPPIIIYHQYHFYSKPPNHKSAYNKWIQMIINPLDWLRGKTSNHGFRWNFPSWIRVSHARSTSGESIPLMGGDLGEGKTARDKNGNLSRCNSNILPDFWWHARSVTSESWFLMIEIMKGI